MEWKIQEKIWTRSKLHTKYWFNIESTLTFKVDIMVYASWKVSFRDIQTWIFYVHCIRWKKINKTEIPGEILLFQSLSNVLHFNTRACICTLFHCKKLVPFSQKILSLRIKFHTDCMERSRIVDLRCLLKRIFLKNVSYLHCSWCRAVWRTQKSLPVHYLIIVQIIYLIIFSKHWDHSESVHKYSPAEAGARGCGQFENFTVLNLNRLT